MLCIGWSTAGSLKRKRKGAGEATGAATAAAARRLLAAVALSMVVSLMAGCALLPQEEVQEKLPEIRAPKISQKPEYPVKRGTLESKVSGSGKLMSEREENLVFTEENRRIAEVHVKAGDRVKAGQLLAELDMGDTESQIRRKEIELEMAELNLKSAMRESGDAAGGAVALRKQQLEYELIKEDLADLRDSLKASKLVAPYDGTIVSFTAEKGDLAKAYEKVGQIADLSALVVAAGFSSSALSGMAPGMDAVVSINTAGDFTGSVRRLPVDASATAGSLDALVLIDLPELPEGIGHGTPLSAAVTVERRADVLTIPVAALRKQNSRYYVIVSNKDGTKGEADVEIGLQTQTEVEIVKGLEEGQKVVGK